MDSKTDQAGKVTQYGYDNVGRLQTVTQTLNPGTANAQNLVTSYAYDEVGERISQTDANGHVTRFAYDSLGRRSSRTLPAGGASETYQYDPAGNLHQKTDFNGHTTTYVYDNVNRLRSKTADAFFLTGACAGGACGATSVSFTYTNTGRRRVAQAFSRVSVSQNKSRAPHPCDSSERSKRELVLRRKGWEIITLRY